MQHRLHERSEVTWERLTVYRIPAVGVPQRRELVNAVPSLIKRSHTRLKRAPVAGKFVAKHPSCPDWLLGIIDGLPGTWSSIEDFRTQVSTISTNIYPWKGNKNTIMLLAVYMRLSSCLLWSFSFQASGRELQKQC